MLCELLYESIMVTGSVWSGKDHQRTGKTKDPGAADPWNFKQVSGISKADEGVKGLGSRAELMGLAG